MMDSNAVWVTLGLAIGGLTLSIIGCVLVDIYGSIGVGISFLGMAFLGVGMLTWSMI